MTRNHIDIDARYISGLVHLGSRYSMHLEAGFVLTQCHLRPKWTEPIVKSVPSWADGRWKRLCRGTTECVAVCSVARPYVSSGLDATCAEGAWCSELLRFTKTALSQHCWGHGFGYSSVADHQLGQVSQIPHENTIPFDLQNCYHGNLKIIK